MRKDDWELILALYQNPNLTKAAGQLFLSQPALTKRLRQIEDEFGVIIVNRNSKGVTFTPEGEYLAEQAEKFVSLLQETHKNLERMKDGEAGTIKIGSPTSFTRSILPQISGDIPKMVQLQKIQIGFVNGDQQHDAEQFLCSIGQAYLVSNSPIVLEELPHRPLLRFYRDSFSRNLVNEWWKSHFQEPVQIGMEVIDIDTCREMLLNGLGYSIIYSNYFNESDDRFYKMPMLYADGSPVIRNTWMVYRHDYRQTALIRYFVDYIRESISPVVLTLKRELKLFD